MERKEKADDPESCDPRFSPGSYEYEYSHKPRWLLRRFVPSSPFFRGAPPVKLQWHRPDLARRPAASCPTPLLAGRNLSLQRPVSGIRSSVRSWQGGTNRLSTASPRGSSSDLLALAPTVVINWMPLGGRVRLALVISAAVHSTDVRGPPKLWMLWAASKRAMGHAVSHTK